MPDDHEGQSRKLLGFYEGPVVDNKDPLKLCRVKVNVPGIAEPTGWARPMGMAGAGGKKRGGWSPPPIGAEVGVVFKMGDPDHPRYFPGYPGEGEAPDEVDEASVEEAVKIPFVFNGDIFKIVIDERPSGPRAALENKLTGDIIELDGKKLGVFIKGTSAVAIQSEGAFAVEASSITLNGRIVAPTKKPI
jgi:hypothetical protein